MNLSLFFFAVLLSWPDRSRDNALLQAIAFNVDATGILLRQRTSRGGFAGTRDAIDDPDIHHTGSHTSVGLTPGPGDREKQFMPPIRTRTCQGWR
jgi:hypothetical protein